MEMFLPMLIFRIFSNFNKNNSSATLCVQEQEMIFPYGVVEVNGMSLEILMKSQLISI